jgi:transposase InsO family protein
MKRHHRQLGLGRLCRLFGKSRQAFYDHNHRDTAHHIKESVIVDAVKLAKTSVSDSMGAIKTLKIIRPELENHQISIGRDRFFRLLKDQDLLVKTKKRYAITTDSNHPFRRYEDLTGTINLSSADQLWVSDITYVRTWRGFAYLSIVTDAYSRKIVGYHLSQSLSVKGCLIALNKAIASRQHKDQRLIHHSDRGIQYCCDAYVNCLKEHNIAISMTQNGSPYENALAERVNGILKTELGLNKTFTSYRDAIGPVHKAVDIYNRLRPHMSLDYLTPSQAHKVVGTLKRRWKANAYKPCQTPIDNEL